VLHYKNACAFEGQQRSEAVPIKHPVHGEFLINDQAPVNFDLT
jgi:hypothetical protein